MRMLRGKGPGPEHRSPSAVQATWRSGYAVPHEWLLVPVGPLMRHSDGSILSLDIAQLPPQGVRPPRRPHSVPAVCPPRPLQS